MAAVVSVSGASVVEATTGSDPNFLSFVITLSEAAANAVTVGYRLLSGTAQAGADVYSFNSGTSVTFAPGETSKTVSWRVNGDAEAEPDEAVVLEVYSASGGATLAGNATLLRATGWVLDDDGAGNKLALYASRPVVVEGDAGSTLATFELSLSRPAPAALAIAYSTVDGSARAGEDYTATSGTLNFVAGQTTATVSVPVLGDAVAEPSDGFTLAFALPSAVAAGSLGEAIILDDDAGTPTVSVTGASNFEATTGSDPNFLGFAITLSEASATAVTVGYRLLSGTAQAGFDVYSFNSGTSVTFAPGETSKTVSWRISGDATVETDEAVVLEVYSASGGAALAGNSTLLRATGWVLDDDGTGNKLALYTSRPVVVEGDSGTRQANFEVTLSRPAPAAFSMGYTTVDGSAVAGEDYTATTGTLSFVAGQTTASVTVPVLGDTVAEPSDGFTLSFNVPASIAQASLGEAIILDDDAGTPTVSVTGVSNFEATTGSDPNFLGFAITLSEASATAVTVGYRLLSGTAQAGSDVYSFNSGTSVTFDPGETSKTVSWRINGDATVETDEAVVLEVYSASGGAALAGNSTLLRATGWVLDDDGTGNKLALYTSRPVIVEGDSGTRQANFEVSLSRPAPAAFSMGYATVDGSAIAGEDYTATSGTLSFVAGQTTASVSVPVLGDAVAEPSDGFTLSFNVPASIAQASLGEAIILDDDAGTPTVSVTGASADEGTTGSDPNFLGFAITLSEASATAITVGYRLLPGTAGAGTDVYSFNSGTSVTFNPGETSQTVFWRISGDAVAESDEAVVLEVFSVSGQAALAGNAAVLRATGWVLDDDGTGNKLALFSSRPVMVESDSGTRQVNFEISLSRPAPEAMEIAYTTADGTARAGQDYLATSGTLQFVKGQTNASVSVEVIGDTVAEPTDSILLSFNTPAAIAAVSIGKALVMDDDAGTPTVNVTPASNTEATTGSDPNFLTWGITLSEASATPVTVEYRLIGGTAGAGTDVYSFNSGASVTFAAGETSKTVSFRITGDAAAELDEAVVLEVFSASGGAALAGNAPVLRSTGWVLDDDGTGNPLALYASRPLVVEGDSGTRQANFEVSLSRPAPAAFSMTYTTVDGSGLAGQDYVATTGTLSFAAGQATAGVSVNVLGDTVVEPSDFFTLAFNTPASIANASLGEALILDDDAGTPTVSLTGTSNIEGTTGSDPNFLNFGVLLSAPSTTPVTVAYRLLSGTGGAGDDVYSFNSGTSVTFAPGETSKTVSWRISGDAVSEPDEAVVLEAYAVSGSAAKLAGDAPVLRATGWVIDDDGTGNKLGIFTSNPVIVEGDAGTRQANFEISLSRPPTGPITLNYRTLDGTAVAGEDYIATSGTLNLVTGQTQASVSVLLRGDTVLETSDFFTLGFDVPAAVAQASLGEATVLDDDSGNPTVSITGTANVESTTGSDPNFLTFGISLSEASATAVTVDYRLLSGTATAGTDVYSFNSGTAVTFAPGETFKQVGWRISGDTVNESDEAVVMELTSVSGTARFADGVNALRATGWVLDDDGTSNNLALFVESPQIVEGADGFDRQAGAVARLSRPNDAAVDLAWSTSNGSASAGPDYTASSGTLHFAPLQQTAVAWVPIIGDAVNEADETFTVSVTPSAAISSGTAGATGTVTIIDGDRLPPPATLALEAGANLSLNEGQEFSRAVVISDGEDNGAAGYSYTVDYGDGTTASGNVATAALTLNHVWADGPASRTVNFTVTDDFGETASDSFTVTVNNVAPTVRLDSAASVLANQPFTLTLSDYVDPGDDTRSANGILVNWGDGSTTSTGLLGDLSHTYATAGTRTISVSLTDEDGTHSNVASRLVTVEAPASTVALEAGAGASINEGATFTRNIAISDGADGGATGWSYTIDYGDGSAAVAGTTTTPNIALSHLYADGSTNPTVQVSVTDVAGETASDSFALVVANVAPTASVSGLASINEGAPLYTLSVGSVTDPGIDVRSRYSIDWGDGTGVQNFTPVQWQNAAGSFTHLFTDGPGDWLISVRATDEDGTHLLGSQAVRVANVVPVLTLGGSGAILESGNYALRISTTEPSSSADRLTFTIDWGDGSALETVTEAQVVAGAGNARHVYTDDEDGPVNSTPRTITVLVDDGDGGTDTATHVVNVLNQAPTATLSGENTTVNEGSAYTLNVGPVRDQGVDLIQSYRIDWDDGTAEDFSVAQWAVAAGSFSHVFVDGVVGSGPRTVVAYATDEDGTFALGSKAVAVGNLSPTLQVTPGPANVKEGDVYTLTLSATDPGGVHDPLTYDIQWFDATGRQTITAEELAANGGKVSHVFVDDQDGPVNATLRTISVKVSDGDIGDDSEDLTVTVHNVAPSLTAAGAPTATTGVAYTLALSDLVDPGTDTLAFFGITVDWGDGSAASRANALGDLSHTYTSIGARTIRVSLTDEDGTHSNVASRLVTVEAPASSVTIDAGADASINEGATFTRNIAISDGVDGGATGWSYTINYGDGSAGVAGTTTTPNIALNHLYADGSTNPTVQVSVTDVAGETASDSFALVVANVAPTASVSGLASINEGAPLYTLSVGGITDPGNDVRTRYSIDWGDGTGVQNFTPVQWQDAGGSFTHLFADGPGDWVINVRATDEDGTHLLGSQAVQVANVVPILTLGGVGSVPESGNYALSIFTTEPPSSADVLTYTIDWGDGSALQTVTAAQLRAGAGNAFHVFTDDEDGPVNSTPHTITVLVDDGDGGTDTATRVVNVLNQAPTAALSGETTVFESLTYALSVGPVRDQGVDLIQSYRIDWGDGTVEEFNLAQWTAAAGRFNHVFADGPATGVFRDVVAYATDEDGTHAMGSRRVVVNNLAPTLQVTPGPANVDEGSVYTLALSATDPAGSNDPLTYTIQWADGAGLQTITAEELAANGGTVSHVFVDDQNGPINATLRSFAVTVMDGDVGNVSEVVTVTVHNVAPSLTASGAPTATTGVAYALALSDLVDPGTDTLAFFGITVDWGDGSANTQANALGDLSHTYTSTGARTIRVSLADEDGSYADVASVALAVNPPTAMLSLEAGANASLAEGQALSRSIGFSDGEDNGTAGWTYRIDYGDGTVAEGSSAVASLALDHVYADDNSASTVTVKLTDGAGESATDSFTVNVANVAPTASVTGSDRVGEGNTYVLNVGTVLDPGADTRTGYSIAWGDGAVSNFTAGQWSVALGSFSHGYADGAMTPTIAVFTTDEDGTFRLGDLTLNVTNVAPTLSLGGAAATNEGAIFALSLSATDPAAGQDPLAYTIDWGDGSGAQSLSADALAANGGVVNHVFLDDQDGPVNATTRNISVTVDDGDGGSDTETWAVTVNNVAPSLTASGAGTTLTGAAYSLNLSNLVDPGTDALLANGIVVNWGDGTTTTHSSLGDIGHVYTTAGSRNIAVSMIDEDGTHGNVASQALTVIEPAAPLSLEAGGDATLNEGQTFSRTLSFIDGFDDDAAGWFFRIDYGDGSAEQTGSTLVRSLNLSHAYADGNAARQVTVTLLDGEEAPASDSFTVNVANVVPTLTASGAASGTVGTAYVLDLSAYLDPGADALLANGIVVDWGDGSSSSHGTLGSLSHTYGGEARYDIRVSLVDDDGTHANVAGLSVNVASAIPDNAAPLAVDDAFTVFAGQALAIGAPGLLANDSDADGDVLQLLSTNTAGLQGTLSTSADGQFSFAPAAGFVGSTQFSYALGDGAGGSDTGLVTIVVNPLPVETLRLGDAPVRQSGTGGQWAAAWTAEGVQVLHKADYGATTEAWSAATPHGVSPQTLAGGDIYQGDLGISGQSLASSSVRQEIDGHEALRFNLDQSAIEVNLNLARFYLSEDGGLLAEAGLLRVLDSAGNVVAEKAFHAGSAGGTQQVSLAVDQGFMAVELLAGAYDGGDFVFGAYTDADGRFVANPGTDAAGQAHGSDFVLDWIEFDLPVIGIAPSEPGG